MTKRRVLIVEDEVLIALELESIVERALDTAVLMSRSVARAKQLIAPRLDLALLDVDVTNGKTFEVAMLLRLRQIPFVFLSGSRRKHIPDELRDASFIPKPCDEQKLVEQIRKVFPDAPSRRSLSFLRLC
jgi:two-component SAPR family response regulator